MIITNSNRASVTVNHLDFQKGHECGKTRRLVHVCTGCRLSDSLGQTGEAYETMT